MGVKFMNQKFVKYYDLMRKVQRLEMIKKDNKDKNVNMYVRMKKVRKK